MSQTGLRIRKVPFSPSRTEVAADSIAQHWLDLAEAIQREAANMGGYGELTVKVVFNAGLPVMLYVVKSEPHYQLRKTQAPLTGDSPLRDRASGEDDRS
jgi:hypothetical protein